MVMALVVFFDDDHDDVADNIYDYSDLVDDEP